MQHMISRDYTAPCIGVFDPHVSGLDPGPSRTSEQDNWKDRVDHAIDTWSFRLLSQTPSLYLEAAQPLRRIAHISIHVSLMDFQILAGASNLAIGVRAQHESIQFTLVGDGDLARLPSMNKTAGLITTVRITLENCRWELLEEAKDALSRISIQEAILLSMMTSHSSHRQDGRRD
ncbi:hypothetical protein F5Y19DRAFT_481501 [Xylariaceae sp. FL1651]|nr:hypothetical protein F5Y19DRAFT_481501 [Xylariaceae sp. FL1651]